MKPGVRIALALCLLPFLLEANSRTVADDSITSKQKDWPIFRGDTLANGVAGSPLAERPEVLWRFEVPEGAFEGTAAIVDGVVYLGDLDGSLYALNLSDGTERWKYEIDGGFPSSPAVRDGRIYIGDYDGWLHCVDAKTGAELWRFETQAEINACANSAGWAAGICIDED